MKLKEKLQKLQGTENARFIKVGSGTSFFYCSVLNENTYDDLETISNQYHKRYKTDLSRFKAQLPRAKKGTRVNLSMKIERTADYLSKWSNLLDRDVKEVYKSISPDELCTTVIIVKGKEMGDYWTLKEFMK